MTTRDEVAKRIHWEWIIWTAGLVNVTAMLPQVWKLVTTKVTDGLAIEMIFIYFVIQIAFCLEGYFKRNKMFLWCLGLSAVVSAIIIVLYFSYR